MYNEANRCDCAELHRHRTGDAFQSLEGFFLFRVNGTSRPRRDRQQVDARPGDQRVRRAVLGLQQRVHPVPCAREERRVLACTSPTSPPALSIEIFLDTSILATYSVCRLNYLGMLVATLDFGEI